MLREEHDHAVERRGDGVETAEQQEMRRSQQLGVGQRPAFDLSVHERAQQSIVGLGALLLDLALEVRLDRLPGCLALLLPFRNRVGLRPDRVVAPCEELR